MIVFLFVDGLGIGKKDESNPFFVKEFPFFENLFRKFTYYTDPRMNQEGLPQSATGQTAIYTGYNAPKYIGKHKEGFPCSKLKKLIKEESIFKKLIELNYKPAFANTYLIDDIEDIIKSRYVSVTTYMTITSLGKVRSLKELVKGEGVFQDIENRMIANEEIFEGRYKRMFPNIEEKIDATLLKQVKPISPEKAARNLLKVAKKNHFTLFEYFQTDIAGHKQDMEMAIEKLTLLETFIAEIVNSLNLNKDTLFIISDHGNIEDLSIPTHTYNKVPFVVMGKARKFIKNPVFLHEIAPQIIENIHFLV